MTENTGTQQGGDGGSTGTVLSDGAGTGEGGGKVQQQQAATGGSFLDGLDPEVRPAIEAKGYGTPNDLAKAYIESERLVGAKGIILPGKDASEDDWNAFYNSVGRPETVEGYDLNGFEPPEGVPWDQDAQAEFMAGAHKLGLTSPQVSGVLNYYKSYVEGLAKADNDARAEVKGAAEASLRREWGSEFDPNLDTAKSIARQLGGDALIKEIDDNGVGSNVELIKGLHKLAPLLGEDGNLPETIVPSVRMTPEAAKAEVKQMESDSEKRKILLDDQHPEHKALVERRDTLYRIAYPEERRQR